MGRGDGTGEIVAELERRESLARWMAGALDGDRTPPFAWGLAGLEAEESALIRGWSPDDGAARETERIRLFVNGPGGVPATPYASWWVDGQMYGPLATALRRFYEDEGLRASAGGLADYLPGELEFLALLLRHQDAAVRTGREDLHRGAREREREFLERFVLCWVPRFCETGRETASASWAAFFDLLEAFVVDEARRVS